MCCALRVILRGNSTASIPRTISVYVCIGSEPENGGLTYTHQHVYSTALELQHRKLVYLDQIYSISPYGETAVYEHLQTDEHEKL